MKYPELLELSKQRFYDPASLRDIEYLDNFVLDDTIKQHGALEGTLTNLGARFDDDFLEKADEYLRSRNILLARRALIAIGHFDGEAHMRALPMILSDKHMDGYHTQILNEYFPKMEDFKTPGYPDCLEGQAYRQDDQLILAVRHRADILGYRKAAVKALSIEMPDMTMVLSRNNLQHTIYRNGRVERVEIEIPLADLE